MKAKKILLVPLDPVHDVGVRLIQKGLHDNGHATRLLPPDLPLEEIARTASENGYDFLMVGRTISYEVADVMARLADLLDAAGIRERTRIVAGGKAMTPELAAELGFDKGFDSNTKVEEVVAYVEGREYVPEMKTLSGAKPDITKKHTYEWKCREANLLCEEIVDQLIHWASTRTSPGIERAELRKKLFAADSDTEKEGLREEYAVLCSPVISEAYLDGEPVEGTRWIEQSEVELLDKIPTSENRRPIRHTPDNPLAIFFTGSGCPILDIQHNRIAAEYGADGTIFICPSWNARQEGLLEPMVSHMHDGTVPSVENLFLIKKYLRKDMLFQLRAHRGLNTAETALLAVKIDTDFCKVNPIYGSLGGGTDPERLVLDAMYAIKTVSEAGIPYDMPANDELSGIPVSKNLAGTLVTLALGRRYGGRPILKPLFCFSPNVMIEGQMDDNYVDYNAAKVLALREIIDAPIWPGEPVGFYTHEDDRCQSATTTALHVALATSLGVDAFTFASTDESYSRGPITIASRIDTFNSLQTMFRFFGHATISPTNNCDNYKEMIYEDILKVLRKVKERGDFVQSLYEGDFGTEEEGAHPGFAGRGTVRQL